jgi:purine-binding chemotaxis protein CheW
MTDNSHARLLVFRVGNLACAAEVDQVREILPRLPTTRIPGAPPVVAGLVNVRGTLVTVVEGWRALGQSAPEANTAGAAPGGSTLILELEQGLIGLTVDEVTDMTGTSEAPLEDRRGLPGVDPTLVKAVGRRAGQLFVVLNVAALLGPILTSRGEGEQ